MTEDKEDTVGFAFESPEPLPEGAVVIAPFWKSGFKNEARVEGEELLRFFDSVGSGWIRDELAKPKEEVK